MKNILLLSVLLREKKADEVKKFSDLSPGLVDIFKIAKQMRKNNQNISGDKCVTMVDLQSTILPKGMLGDSTMNVFLTKSSPEILTICQTSL